MASSSQSRVDLLKQKIEIAFGSVKYPGDDNLVNDDSGYHLECNEVKQLLKGKSWRDLPRNLKLLWRLRWSLCSLTPAGHHYFLPGLMLGLFNFYDQTDTLEQSLIYNLTPPDPSLPLDSHNWFDEFVRMFTDEQKRVIREFLELLRDEFHGDDEISARDPEEALAKYWRHAT